MYGDAAYRLHHSSPSDSHGYPEAWGLVKDEVREFVGHRCIRCGHPYRVGQEAFYSTEAMVETVREAAALSLFELEPTDEPRVKRDRPIHWSPCDEGCHHGGLVRFKVDDWEWRAEDIGPQKVALTTPGAMQAAWRILTVHHANGNKLDLRWFNLLALCQRCHLSVQSRVQMARVWPWEHTEWFQPYVAGFYAWRYLGEDLSRDEVEARQDELLALERATDSCAG